jgi:glycosyltransferase involved in cell wall biosynthesis
MDKQFGVKIKWDIPLLDGYEYKFFKNYSWKPSQFNGFFGLINIGIIKELFEIKRSVIVVHGWHYFTLFMVLILGKFRGHTVCLRCDVPYNQEILKKGLKQKIKNLALKYFLFKRISVFLYIGTQNKLFYKNLGITDDKLVYCPYAVDNERFHKQFVSLFPQKNQIKESLGIPSDGKVIIFSAKYISKKRPMDLLRAFEMAAISNTWLLFVGEGELRGEMERYIAKNNIQRVILTGFVNQLKISQYYTIGDVLVMCSSMGENWGLSVNEAMNFDLPLILSDLTGCSDDLVNQGANGYVFKTGDIVELAEKLLNLFSNSELSFSPSSLEIVHNYSFNVDIDNLKTLI